MAQPLDAVKRTIEIMLLSIKQLEGNALGALDGEIGHVKEFYFDDQKWAIRYVVVETGSWLAGRKVLVSPHAFGRLRQTEKVLRVKLTRKQIENSPSIDTHKPVSRQYEEEYHRYYGWPYYWQGDALWGMSRVPMMEMPPTSIPAKSAHTGAPHHNEAAAHLRSANAVNGYHIKASDGTIGHVCDFMMDDESWAITQVIVKTGHRFSGKEVQIPTSKVERISYDESTVFVNLTINAVEKSPAHSMVLVGVPD
jgi:sporulation protein YlmC with PRC-barrel domain